MDYEVLAIRSGISEDLQRPAGQSVHWHRFDSVNTEIDTVYAVGDYDGGRRWVMPGFDIPAISAVIFQGQTVQNERGFYQADIARVTFNVADIDRYLPGLRSAPDTFYRDRVIYQNEIFTISRLYLRGHAEQYYTVLTMDLLQVNPEELVNDPQFQGYAA
jgi:hypothetical protein